MAETHKFMDNLMQQVVLGLNVCFPARVLSPGVDSATILPLYKTKEYNEAPEDPMPLEDVPYLMQRYEMHQSKAIDVFIPGGLENHYSETYNEPVLMKPVLKAGDIVLCVVAQRSLDEVLNGQPYLPSKARIFNLQDAVILGVIKYT